MTLKNFLYSDCHLCRTLRAAICAGLIVVLATYGVQLLKINVELWKEGRR